jgi:hypothetical protein
METKILNDYTNPSLPGSFSGLSGFLKNNAKYRKNRSVKKVIRSLPAYTLHKSVRYKFPRSKTIVSGINDQWQVDLVDMSNLAGSNSNYKFILTCIDVFRKFAWAIALLNKTAFSCKQAFEKIFKDSGVVPNLIYSDDGNEFKGECKEYLQSKNIQIFVSKTKNKAAVIERFNRTLKTKMYRFFTFNKSQAKKTNLHNKRYLDVLPKLIESYNNSYHRSIKMSPASVNNQNESQVYRNLYGFEKSDGDPTIVKPAFKNGDYVRIVKDKNIFEKGYTASWSEKIYILDKVIAQVPILYKVKEINETKIENVGLFYEQEIQKIELPFDVFKIVKELPNDQILVQQLNDEQQTKQIVDKSDFMTNQYSLRSRKQK